MSNHEGGTPPGDELRGRLQGVGLVRSGFGGCLVEDEDVGVAEQHPDEGDLLLHFRHERYRARPNLSVEAEEEGPAESGAVLGQAHGSKGVEKLPVGGGGGRHAEIVAQRTGEYVHLLTDEGDVAGGPHVGNLGDVHVTNGDGTGGGA